MAWRLIDVRVETVRPKCPTARRSLLRKRGTAELLRIDHRCARHVSCRVRWCGMGRTSRPVSHGKRRSLATVCSRRTTRTVVGDLGLQCVDESIEMGDASSTDFESFDAVTKHLAVNLCSQELFEQSCFHAVDLVFVHGLSPIIAMRVVKASPVMATYQSAGLVLRVRLNHTTPKRRPPLPAWSFARSIQCESWPE